MRKLGFKAARALFIDALKDGRIRFERRSAAQGKNLLQSGDISPEEVIWLLRRCRGDQYEESPHHFMPEVPCHIFKPEIHRIQWYVKGYRLSDDVFLISVHTSEWKS